MRQTISRLGLVVALGAASLLPGCDGCVRHSAPTRAVFGTVSSVSEVDLTPYLTVAHAIITRSPAPGVEPPTRPGARVFVTWWSPGSAAVRATGLGPTLLDSVKRASEDIAQTAKAPGRVELEVVTEVAAGNVEADAKGPASHAGIYGYSAYDNERDFGWVTPSEIVMDKLVDAREEHPTKLKKDELITRLSSRAGVSHSVLPRMARMRFKVETRIEASSPGAPAVELFRSMPLHATSLTADELLDAVRDAADYIARGCDARGKFVYEYNPVLDEVATNYEILRHAGAIYALMEAYAELHVDAWRAAAERAILYLDHEYKTSPDGAWIQQWDKEEQQRSGGAGLALVALAKYTEATGDKRNLARMRELARFIVAQQQPDGHFRENADLRPQDAGVDAGPALKKEVPYYAGEATLGLTRLYSLDPGAKWLDAARKSADYVIRVRDAQADEKHQIADHWMSYALYDLYALTKDSRFADHAFKIGHAIVHAEMRDRKGLERDYNGAFFDRGQTTASSTRLEALAVQVQLSRLMGLDDAWARGPAMEVASFTRGQQIDGEAIYFAFNPARARGGVRESLLSNEVRIDYVQHALSGWLRLSHEVRDPTWGAPK